MKIAVIGGGFSALSLSLQIVSHGTGPLSLYICEQQTTIGLGTAYATPFPWHLLNVRAARMGVSSDDPSNFYDWLQNNEPIWRKADPLFKNLLITEEAFLPRKLYGVYLSEKLKEIHAVAASKNIHFEMINNNVIDIAPVENNQFNVIFSNHQLLNVDKLILATSTPPVKRLSFAIQSQRYIPNPWELNEQQLKHQISCTNKDSQVLIIGTGLTMVDMVTSLDKLGYPGKVIAISPHGQLPEAHCEKSLPSMGDLSRMFSATKLVDKIRAFRQEIKNIVADGGSWVQLFEALRPVTTDLWKQLSLSDKKRFLKHFLSSWNKHRHRIPLESKKLIENLIQQGRLEIISGKIDKISEAHLLEVQYKHGHGNENESSSIKANFIYNCAGPNYNPKIREDLLFKNLLDRKIITTDALELGIKCDSNFLAEGCTSMQIYAIGSLLYGECFETTAVPDIRKQAKAIALHILNNN